MKAYEQRRQEWRISQDAKTPLPARSFCELYPDLLHMHALFQLFCPVQDDVDFAGTAVRG